jgi:hypothetical protein
MNDFDYAVMLNEKTLARYRKHLSCSGKIGYGLQTAATPLLPLADLCSA